MKTDDFNDEDRGICLQNGLWVLLKFTFTPTYPEEVPLVEIEEEENMEEEMVHQLMARLRDVAEENLGMAMVFTIVSEAIQWLAETNDRIKREEEEEKQKKKDAEDEEERKKLEGTKVTIESFLSWKAGFDAEKQAERSAAEREKALKKSKKKNGRELFLTDTSLVDSDVKFLAEAGDSAAVTVDESLFEDLDDLDLDDEDSDDPDYCPGDSD